MLVKTYPPSEMYCCCQATPWSVIFEMNTPYCRIPWSWKAITVCPFLKKPPSNFVKNHYSIRFTPSMRKKCKWSWNPHLLANAYWELNRPSITWTDSALTHLVEDCAKSRQLRWKDLNRYCLYLYGWCFRCCVPQNASGRSLGCRARDLLSEGIDAVCRLSQRCILYF